jgi:UDP-N-acetylglucosamine 2-epimerase (non-hydrolysing)
MTKKLLFVFGTRPEAIKLVPLIKLAQKNQKFDVTICVTGQHREMLDQILGFFKIKPDYDLNLMKPNQRLSSLFSKIILGLEDIPNVEKTDYIIVQGDTNTVLAASLFAFYNKIKIAHVEAGLRSFNLSEPFPEEGNRLLTSKISDLHFVPTKGAKSNLIKEKIKNNIYLVGNTVIDALLLGLKIIENDDSKYLQKYQKVDFTKKIILVTCHRRENFGSPMENIFKAIAYVSEKYKDEIEVVFPVHLNPNVQNLANKILHKANNIHLIAPADYPDWIWLMKKSYFIMTDSGGVQEEAPTLGKPILVMRDVTERAESIAAGAAKLVGSDYNTIVSECEILLNNQKEYQNRASVKNPYGNGKSSEKIIGILEKL